MSFVSPQEFIKQFSPDSAPSEHTVRRWIDQRTIPGRKIGGRYFVDEDAFFARGNPIVEKVLRDVSRSA